MFFWCIQNATENWVVSCPSRWGKSKKHHPISQCKSKGARFLETRMSRWRHIYDVLPKGYLKSPIFRLVEPFFWRYSQLGECETPMFQVEKYSWTETYSSIPNSKQHEAFSFSLFQILGVKVPSWVFETTWPSDDKSYINITSRWFQPIWKILVQLDHFPR